MTLRLPQAMLDEMVAHATDELPNECCGIIAGQDGTATRFYRTKNSEASPFRYNIDPRDILRIERDIDDNDWQVLVIYHSHVASEAYPSQKDVRLAFYPEASYLIVSLSDMQKPVLRSFKIKEEKVTEEEIRLA